MNAAIWDQLVSHRMKTTWDNVKQIIVEHAPITNTGISEKLGNMGAYVDVCALTRMMHIAEEIEIDHKDKKAVYWRVPHHDFNSGDLAAAMMRDGAGS